MHARLLWVDDEIELLRPHCIFLEKRNYHIVTCSNGRDAIELCQEQQFDLVLLDENMPGLSGLETLVAIKAIQPTLPIVMVTKNEAEDLMDQAIGEQIADFLLKPVSPAQILIVLKRHIHSREIVQQQSSHSYRNSMAQIAADIDTAQHAEDWKQLYKQLTHWEMRLEASGDATMVEMLQYQKQETEVAFGKWVKQHYEHWFTQPTADRPLLSHEVLRKRVFPLLQEGKRVTLLVLDNLRFDQWRCIAEELTGTFDLDEDLYFSILPTATQYARNALFAGLMPLQIKEKLPHLWVEENEEEGKNLHEESLLQALLQRYRRKESMSYHKLNDSAAIDKFLHIYPQLTQQLRVVVINFIDILSHTRTDNRMVRELVHNEAAYRDLTLSWLRNTSMRELLSQMALDNACVVLTTDHGSIRVDNPTKVVGEKELNNNLRYKVGRNLNYKEKDVFVLKAPQKIQLPHTHLSAAYIFALDNKFFAYPNNYNHYVAHYRNSFQHGGVSMSEMIVPLITLTPKKR